MSLETKDLTVGYLSKPILSGINERLKPSELTVLIGSNGSGKSTLLRTLAGAQKPLSGEVVIDSEPISAMSNGRLAKKLAVVLTDRTGGGGLKVNELVAIGRHPYSGFLGRLSAHDREVIEEALKKVGLAHKSQSYVSELSDGERQKAMIARAIAQETPIVILDEPTSFLDVSSRFEIMELLSDIALRGEKSILLSTHDTSAALSVAGKVWAVADGTIQSGTIEDMAENGVLSRVFQGVDFDRASLDFRRRPTP